LNGDLAGLHDMLVVPIVAAQCLHLERRRHVVRTSRPLCGSGRWIGTRALISS